MKRKQEQAEEVADVTTQMRVMLLDSADFYNLAKPGEMPDIRRPGDVVTVDAEFAQQLVTNKYAIEVAQD